MHKCKCNEAPALCFQLSDPVGITVARILEAVPAAVPVNTMATAAMTTAVSYSAQ